jgi:hypothetical protein
MAQKKHSSSPDQLWADPKKRYKLTDEHISMAKELGLNPKKFGSYAPNKQEPWKAPLSEFIEEIYLKQFKKKRPENTRSE